MRRFLLSLTLFLAATTGWGQTVVTKTILADPVTTYEDIAV